jgi:hypothetical protein
MAGEDASDASVLQAARSKCWLVRHPVASRLALPCCVLLTRLRWAQARDAYYACADSTSAFPCWRARRAFAAACPSAWVKHFDKKRADKERVQQALQLLTQPRFSKPQPPDGQQQAAS